MPFARSRHLGDPAVFAIALGAAGRVHLGVSIHQADLDDVGSGWKLKRDDLAYAIAVASPEPYSFLPSDILFRHVGDRVAGIIGGLRCLATDLHLGRHQRCHLLGVRYVSEARLSPAGLPKPGAPGQLQR